MYVRDEMVPSYGPFMISKPLIICHADVDGAICTNRMRLILNWKWNFDIRGFTLGDLERLGICNGAVKRKNMVIGYKKKYDTEDKLHACLIDLCQQRTIMDGCTKDILFGEIAF